MVKDKEPPRIYKVQVEEKDGTRTAYSGPDSKTAESLKKRLEAQGKKCKIE